VTQANLTKKPDLHTYIHLSPMRAYKSDIKRVLHLHKYFVGKI